MNNITAKFVGERGRMFVFSLILITILTVCDQILKYFVNLKIDMYETIEVVKIGSVKIFSLTHIRNDGAAWSIMAGKSWFLIGLPIIVILIGLVYLFRIRKKSKFEVVSLAILIAGGIGNLIDRIRLKEVIDYIKFEPINFPVFNFADICVVVGGIMFCIYMLIVEERNNRKKSEKTDG